MPDLPILKNRDARRLFLARHALASEEAGSPDLLDLISRLGFVQVDSINTVERAHHMILGARSKRYRPKHLKKLLEKDRSLFEHWTHDAAVVPTEFFPHWQLRFRRDAVRLRALYKDWHRAGFEEKFEAVIARIRDHGPCGSRDVGEDEARGTGGWWDWHPSKTALEYLWRAGKLSVCRREGFQKVYDLTERIIPEDSRTIEHSEDTTIDWACNAAMDRLGFATSGEIAKFWDKITPDEAKAWCATQDDLIQIGIECDDGKVRPSFARPDVFQAATDAPEAPSGLRILSPFDPALRDRNRAERLFGFHYRIEIFVPEPKRKYGYYVFPVLERDRITGRIDMKRDPATSALSVRAFWPERGVKLGAGRLDRLDGELHRMARFSGCDGVTYQDGWQRETLA
ncbi:MAG: crosslink repair DNA glycosylase YcaQ family protein [Pseudomonadota bacterium]